ncbi:Pentatricopeptide repeat-containing protein At1g80270, mitochondrial [Linum perenne]
MYELLFPSTSTIHVFQVVSHSSSKDDEGSGGTIELEGNEDELASSSESDPNDKEDILHQTAKYYIASSELSVEAVMNNWVKEGKDLVESMVNETMLGLHNRRMFSTALQLSEWLEASKKFDFKEADYASRVDLIAKLLGFERTVFTCNHMLVLYKNKIADVLLVMEEENVKPNPFTYQLLIDTKGESNDIAGT